MEREKIDNNSIIHLIFMFSSNFHASETSRAEDEGYLWYLPHDSNIFRKV